MENIYITVNSATPRKTLKRYGYVLEHKTDTITRTVEGFGEIEATYHISVMEAIMKAFGRFTRACDVTLYVDDMFVVTCIKEHLSTWAANGYKTTRGKPVANEEKWKALYETMAHFSVTVMYQKHEYTNWLMEQMNKE